jgi:heme a synthase
MNRIRHIHAVLTAVATLALICLGGLVTSHGVGLAVPDWPNTYGYNMFFFPISDWVGGIFYEHTHRLLGSLVGLMTLVLTLWLYGTRSRPWLKWGGAMLGIGGLLWAAWVSGRKDWALLVAATGGAAFAVSWVWPRCPPAPRLLRWLGMLALVGVVVQGVLGGLRVVLLADPIGVFHGVLAQLFLLLLCVIALLTSPWWARTADRWELAGERARMFRALVWITTVLILGQLVLGASMRHRHAGLAVPDFPLAHGGLWPATDADSMARYNRERPELTAVNYLAPLDIHLHMVHRFLGIAIVGLLVMTAVRARGALGAPHLLARGALLWAILGGVQLLLGAITVWSNKSADLTTAHVAVGSVLLAWGGLLTLLVFRPRGVDRAQRAALGPEVVSGDWMPVESSSA